MSHNKDKLIELLKQADWSPEDQRWLLDFLDSEDTDLLRELLNQQFLHDVNIQEPGDPERARQILEELHQKIERDKTRTTIINKSFRKFAIAVSLIFLLISSYFIYQYSYSPKPIETVPLVAKQKEPPKDLIPGTDKAVLTLSDGSIVILDEASEGNIATQSSVDIRKLNAGALIYQANALSSEIVYNSISTPRGGKFHITLSDGTKVWLNAASSLRFPVNFTGTERRVELTGEGYFEVAKNQQKPFIVDVNGKEEVLVLGTHFNINSYTDEESIRTTLLEGSVKVRSKGSEMSKTLVPGQQHRLYDEGKSRMLNNVNTEETIAWKNDKFDFGESMELRAVMRQIERWYNVDVQYKGDVSGIELGGSISRNVSASKVFQMLELTGVASFSIENGKVIVNGKKR